MSGAREHYWPTTKAYAYLNGFYEPAEERTSLASGASVVSDEPRRGGRYRMGELTEHERAVLIAALDAFAEDTEEPKDSCLRTMVGKDREIARDLSWRFARVLCSK